MSEEERPKNFHDLGIKMDKNNISWKKFGRKMGLPEYEITCIETSYHGNYEQSVQCLELISQRYKKKNVSELLEKEIDNIIKCCAVYMLPIIHDESNIGFNFYHAIAEIMEKHEYIWRELGKLTELQLEDYQLKLIDEQYNGWYEKSYQLLLSMDCRNCNNTLAFDLCFWVKLLENIHPNDNVKDSVNELDRFLTENQVKRENAIISRKSADINPKDLKRMLCNVISEKFGAYWKDLGKILGIPESQLRIIEHNADMDLREKAWKCINFKCQSSEKYINENWSFWRQILCNIEAGKTIVKELETKYPTLYTGQGNKDPHLYMHKENGFMIHSFGVQKDLNMLPFDKEKSMSLRTARHNIDVKHGDYVKKIGKLHEFQDYMKDLKRNQVLVDFRNSSIVDNPDIVLNVLQNYSKEKGFILKNYCLYLHYRLFGKKHFLNMSSNSELYLVYFEEDNILIHIVKVVGSDPLPIAYNLIEEQAQLALSLHSLRKVLQVGMVLQDSISSDICKECTENRLIMDTQSFQTKFTGWYSDVKAQWFKMKRQIDKKHGNVKLTTRDELLKTILAYKYIYDKQEQR